MQPRHRSIVLVAAGLFAVVGRTAAAQNVEFNGSAFGCFYTTTVCTPKTSGSKSVSDAGLTFAGGTFDGTTVGGTLHLNSGIGWFSLSNLVHNYTADNEKLVVDFKFVAGCPACVPTGKPTAFDVIFIGAITGNVTTGAKGGVNISWDGPHNFTFTESIGGQLFAGDADFSLNALDIKARTSFAPETGAIVLGDPHLVTPEPASVVLIATGLAGMIPVVRSARRQRGVSRSGV